MVVMENIEEIKIFVSRCFSLRKKKKITKN